jgi:hypothetical protein
MQENVKAGNFQAAKELAAQIGWHVEQVSSRGGAGDMGGARSRGRPAKLDHAAGCRHQ